MQEPAPVFSLYPAYIADDKITQPASTSQAIVMIDDDYADQNAYDIIYKFKNIYGKWAFKWIKKGLGKRNEFMSEFAYDEILSAKSNRISFMKDGKKGFWFYNTRTEFYYP
jgi:hypothetical protein